ncbi:proteasome activator pa28 [Flammula alnicola]|nr:proteasome activator pa28 [Flammula alnicola]
MHVITRTSGSELHQIIQGSSTPTSLSQQSYSPSSVSGVRSFAGGPLEPPVKKRKYSDPLGSDSLTNHESLAIENMSETPISLSHKRLAHKKIHEIIKKECEAMVHLTDQARLWLVLTFPKAERVAENPALDFQEDLLAELHRAQESAMNMRDIARKDHLARAKICSKLIKYSGVEDYVLALKEHDEQQLFLAHQHLNDLRNIYVALTDTIRRSGVLGNNARSPDS